MSRESLKTIAGKDQWSHEDFARALEYVSGEPQRGASLPLLRDSDAAVPSHGEECPLCRNGTVEVVLDEVLCRGECGNIWRQA